MRATLLKALSIRALVATLSVGLLMAAIACASGEQSPEGSSPVPEPPIVYAHYMHCFVLGAMPKGLPQRPNLGKLEQFPENEYAMRSWWSPRLSNLSQSGLEGVKEDFRLAKRAGLDAFAVLIGSKHLPHSQYSDGLNLVAKVAETDSIKVIPDLWDGINPAPSSSLEEWRRYGENVKNYIGAHPGAFLRYQGKTVISLGAPLYRSDVTSWNQWSEFFDALGGKSNFYVITDIASYTKAPIPEDFGSHSDAFSYWDTWAGWGDNQHANLVDVAKKYGKAISWPVHPSYFGGRQGAEAGAETLGVSKYCDDWRSAIYNKAKFVEVESWNDFSEDHAITETNLRGDSLIDLTRFWADEYHGITNSFVDRDKLFLFHHRQEVEATLSDEHIKTHNDKFKQTPFVDYLDVVSILKAPGRLELKDGRQSWSIEAPKGFHEWLVYEPSRAVASTSSNEAFTRPGSYPQSKPSRTVEVADRIGAHTPELSLSRSGDNVITLDSRAPLSETSKWKDLSLIGDESE